MIRQFYNGVKKNLILLAAFVAHYGRLERLPALVLHCLHAIADFDFWSRLIVGASYLLADVTRALLIAAVGLLWWTLVLVRRERRTPSVMPEDDPADSAKGNVVDIREHRAWHVRRRHRTAA